MPFNEIMRAHKAGSESMSDNRQRRRAKHDKNAHSKQEDMKLKAEKIKEAKQKAKVSKSAVTAMQGKFAAAQKAQQEEMAFFTENEQDQNFRVKAKPLNEQAYQAKLMGLEEAAQLDQQQLGQQVSELADQAGAKMVQSLSHFVNNRGIGKEEFGPILAELKSKESFTAADFKQLSEINNTVIEAYADAPQVQESLRSGAKFNLDPETMELLADESAYPNQATEKDVELTSAEVAVESELEVETAAQQPQEKTQNANVENVIKVDPAQEQMAFFAANMTEDSYYNVKLKQSAEKSEAEIEPSQTATVVEGEFTAKEQTAVEPEPVVEEHAAAKVSEEFLAEPEHVEPAALEVSENKPNLVDRFKAKWNNAIDKLQQPLAAKYKQLTGENIKAERVEPTMNVDEQSLDEEVTLQETTVQINKDSILKGQNPHVYANLSDENVMTIDMSDDLMTAKVDQQSREGFNPEGYEQAEVEVVTETATFIQQRLPESSVEVSKQAEQTLASKERVEPTIDLDQVPEIEMEKHSIQLEEEEKAYALTR
ncbi:MAG: hypothetical protein VX154_03070 [Pseudomonadota bacterium]|nr:hypothetical protein [Pseudomonadota bacterium]